MKQVRHAAWLVLMGAAHAADPSLPQVSVSATRSEAPPFEVPASIDVVDGDRLRQGARPGNQLSESLATVPGVTARDRQNYAQDLQLSIRGFGARSTFGVRGVRLYMDGIPATMPDGQGQLSHFDLQSAERVEVLRGPFSALYGNSSGGVLQLFTRRGEGAPTVTGVYSGGSSGLSKPGLQAQGSHGSLGYNVSASHMSLDGWREHSAATRDLGNLRLDWSAAGGEWMLAANFLDLAAQDPLGLTRAQYESDPRSVDPAALNFDTRKTVRQGQVGLTHETQLAPGHSLRLLAYYGERTTEQFQAIPVGTQANPRHPGGVIDLERGYAGADVRWTWRADRFELIGGLAYDSLEEDRRGRENFVGSTLGVKGRLRRDEDNTVTNLDPYLQARWNPAERWTLTAGVRRSRVEFESRDRFVSGTNGDDSGAVAYSEMLPAAGVMFAISPTLHAYGTVGRGFETPTFNELAYRPDGTPGLNFGLRPARSTNYELGLKGRILAVGTLRSDWSAAVFQTDTRDEIVTQTNVGGRSTFQNAGKTRRRGLELGWATHWSGDWSLQFAHTWLDARYRESFRTCNATPCMTPTLTIPAGNRIPGIAPQFTALEFAYLPVQGWRAGGELRRSGKVWVNDANTDAAEGWWTAGAFLGYAWVGQNWRMEATGRVDNLFDRTYAGSVIVNEGNSRFFEPAPGRQYVLQLTATHSF